LRARGAKRLEKWHVLREAEAGGTAAPPPVAGEGIRVAVPVRPLVVVVVIAAMIDDVAETGIEIGETDGMIAAAVGTTAGPETRTGAGRTRTTAARGRRITPSAEATMAMTMTARIEVEAGMVMMMMMTVVLEPTATEERKMMRAIVEEKIRKRTLHVHSLA